MGQESCLHYSFAIYLHCRAIQKHISKDVCVRFDIWVVGNVAGFAQKNMVAHVSADLLLDLFVDLFVELFVHLCVNRFCRLVRIHVC